jgi:hypothetical protein
MSVETMQELLIDELKDLYSAEKHIVRALPKLAKAGAITRASTGASQSFGGDEGTGKAGSKRLVKLWAKN